MVESGLLVNRQDSEYGINPDLGGNKNVTDRI